MNSQSFLTGVFHNHVISSSQVNCLLKNCVDLDLMLKKVFFLLFVRILSILCLATSTAMISRAGFRASGKVKAISLI